jgi:hypothetical protein
MIIGLLLTLAQPAIADDPTVEELLNATDDIQRGESSIGVIEMQVKTSRYERTMRMKAWSEGTEKSLIVIESPAKDAGIATLKVDDNIWNYLPKVDRTMKVPSGMMSGSWMGSHFSNDDLVRENRLSEQFTSEITSRPNESGEGNWVIKLVPNPDAPVVWGSLVVTVRPDKIPVSIAYFEEDGTLARTMKYEDVREIGGKEIPGTMTLTPADKPEEMTQIRYIELEFDADVPASTFTLQALKQ